MTRNTSSGHASFSAPAILSLTQTNHPRSKLLLTCCIVVHRPHHLLVPGTYSSNMPRSKVDPLRRRRVAQACDGCRRRKEKCNGASPCEQCKSRRLEATCKYTRVQPPAAASPLLREARSSSNNSESENQNALRALDDLAPPETPKEGDNTDTVLTSAPVPKVSRMLQNSQGRFSMSYRLPKL